jgi:hypothetical protein
MLPPLTNSPPQSAGYPISSAIQRTAWDSISVAIGDSVQAPTFALTDAASNSARMPIGAGDEVI